MTTPPPRPPAQVAVDMARDTVLAPRVTLALVRAAVALAATSPDDETIPVRVRHGRSMVLVGRVLSDPDREGKRAQWAIAASRDDLVAAWKANSAGLTDAQLDTAAAQVWDALTVA